MRSMSVKNHPAVNRNSEIGFTLVELMIVVTIIGIIAAIALASLGLIKENARDKRRLTDITAIRHAMNLYATDNGSFPRLAGTHCIGKNNGETCWGDTNMPGSTALTQALQPHLKTIPMDPVSDRGWGDTYLYLDGFINVGCTPASESGQFILYRPNKQPAAQSDCQMGTYACCGTGGPCATLGGYYCAVKLD